MIQSKPTFLLKIIGCFLFLNACKSPIQEQILGRWNLEIIEYFDEETNQWIQSSWMKDGTGLIEYNPDGRMNVHFAPKNFENLTPLSDSIPLDMKFKELSQLNSDYWYLGDYELIDNNTHITHKRIMHSNPWDWGIIVKRKIEFLGDTLVLTSTERETNLRLKWTRDIWD